jgi:hypothetical protein
MIEAGLEFDDDRVGRVVDAFAALPPSLRPVHFSHEEHVQSAADRIDDQARFSTFVSRSQSGFFLLGQEVTYSIRIATGRSLVCDCFLKVEPELAKQLLVHMSAAGPIFAYACSPEEREHRNRLVVRRGTDTIEGWVGRDPKKYVPGLYWLTFLSDALMKMHDVSWSALAAAAREQIKLEGGQLFRFYEWPEDWQKTTAVSSLCASLPGVFDIERIKPELSTAKTVLDLTSMLRRWK